MDSTIAHYVTLFSNLRVDKSPARHPAATNHCAPHKPLLLLSVLDLFEKGSIQTNLVEPTPELADMFARHWSRVMPAERSGILALPFFHLRNDGFWYLVPKAGKKDALAASKQIKSLSRLRDIVVGARLEENLYELLHIHEARSALRATLLEVYFTPELRSIS